VAKVAAKAANKSEAVDGLRDLDTALQGIDQSKAPQGSAAGAMGASSAEGERTPATGCFPGWSVCKDCCGEGEQPICASSIHRYRYSAIDSGFISIENPGSFGGM
jgi:hypothetical protein